WRISLIRSSASSPYGTRTTSSTGSRSIKRPTRLPYVFRHAAKPQTSATFIDAWTERLRLQESQRSSRDHCGTPSSPGEAWSAKRVGQAFGMKVTGVAPEVMAQVAGHSLAINKKRYRNAIEPLIKLPLHLAHEDDPTPAQTRKLKVVG